MMRHYELVERVQAYNPKVNEELLNQAYVYAMQKHGLQKRASGDPYFSHPLEVAAILTKLRLDDATIAVALLHDTIEDTDATRQEIDQMFGHEIGALVDGLTKIKRLDLESREVKQAQNFRKLLLAVSEDVRVLLVKLADRLHNMRTLDHVPEDKRKRIAQETLDIYAPLAGRMGMQDFRDEMEEIGFQIVNPDAYETITRQMHKVRADQQDLIAKIERELTDELAAKGLKARVKGREKRAYSIFRKMERKSVAFEQLSDIFGFRVIVDDVPACYAALGLVHTRWPVIPGRFKDYISTPKQNDYQSIHTTVMIKRHRVELQIRTEDMHRIAEVGIAAHALYKDGGSLVGGRNVQGLMSDSGALAWLRTTIKQLAEGVGPEDFLENTKLELFQDQVFCFTPKGKLIALPRGATIIDFAYAVHTDIGNTMVGAKVNGRMAPITSELRNGDEVEILRSARSTVAPPWETIVQTGRARAAIRKATRDAKRLQHLELGRVLMRRAFETAGVETTDAAYDEIAGELKFTSSEELMVALGRDSISQHDVRKVLAAGRQNDVADLPPPAKTIGERVGQSVPIRGVTGGLPIHFAPRGGAVPGDRIIGILEAGKGVTIYPIQSPSLQAFESEPERWMEVRWDLPDEHSDRFPASLDLEVVNEPGVLAEIASEIAGYNANIDNISVTSMSRGFRAMQIGLEVADLKHLMHIIRGLNGLGSVSKVQRFVG